MGQRKRAFAMNPAHTLVCGSLLRTAAYNGNFGTPRRSSEFTQKEGTTSGVADTIYRDLRRLRIHTMSTAGNKGPSKSCPAESGGNATKVKELDLLKATDGICKEDGKKAERVVMYKMLADKFGLSRDLTDDEKGAVRKRMDHVAERLTAQEEPAFLLSDRKIRRAAKKWFRTADPTIKMNWYEAISHLESFVGCFLTERTKGIVYDYIKMLGAEEQVAQGEDSNDIKKHDDGDEECEDIKGVVASSERASKRHRGSNGHGARSDRKDLIGDVVDGFVKANAIRTLGNLNRQQRVNEVKKVMLATETLLANSKALVGRLERDFARASEETAKVLDVASSMKALVEQHICPKDREGFQQQHEALKKLEALIADLSKNEQKDLIKSEQKQAVSSLGLPGSNL